MPPEYYRADPSMPFADRVAAGLVSYASSVLIYGRNVDVDEGTEDIWPNGGTWAPPTAARIHTLASTSVQDAVGGTGIAVVTVEAIDADYNAFSEDVTLTGTDGVAMATAAVTINRMRGKTAGTASASNTATAVGSITATAAVDATVTAVIRIGHNNSESTIYMVPAGKVFNLEYFDFGAQKATGAQANLDAILYVRPFGGVWYAIDEIAVDPSSTVRGRQTYPSKVPIAEKSFIKVAVTSSAANVECHAGYGGTLITVA